MGSGSGTAGGGRLTPLTGRVALVTGGSRGIGRAIALALAGAGARVAVGYHQRQAEAEAVVAAIREAGGEAVAFQADLGDPAQAAALVERAAARWGRLDILVNNAGIALYKLLLDTTPAEWQRLLAVDLGGTIACSRAAIPHMLAAGWGRIINISSVWGLVGAAGEVVYSAAKAGVIGFTKALAKELARAGITVNAVAPGAIETEMLAHLSPEERTALAGEIPMGRLGRPEEVAAAVLFLASPDAGYITGQVLSPSGGWAT